MNIAELLFPTKCVCCRELLTETEKKNEAVFCESCRIKFEAEKYHRCSRCGRQHVECECMPPTLQNSACCKLMHVCAYNGNLLSPVTRMIFTLKKKANGKCERFAAEQISQRLKEYLAENSDCDFCITYIPRRRRSIVKYGHDHGAILAKNVGKACGLEVLDLLENKRGSREQKNLNVAGRIKNVRGMLSASGEKEKVSGRNVVLIDDVSTSGASLAAGTDVLMEHGAASVTCLCLAVTEKKRK